MTDGNGEKRTAGITFTEGAVLRLMELAVRISREFPRHRPESIAKCALGTFREAIGNGLTCWGVSLADQDEGDDEA